MELLQYNMMTMPFDLFINKLRRKVEATDRHREMIFSQPLDGLMRISRLNLGVVMYDDHWHYSTDQLDFGNDD